MSGIDLTESKTQFRSFIVQEENFGDRLDVFVGEVAQSSRSNAEKDKKRVSDVKRKN